MKRISALLVVFMIVLLCALPTTAMAQFDSFKQKLINQGYTQEDLWAIDAILLYSNENVPSFIVGKYKTLKDWDKVCAYYGVDKKQFDNYIDGMKRWQEVLDKVPDTVMAEMKAKGWSQQEINEFVNKMNLNQIDYEYAWKEYKSGKTVDELVEAKVSENKAVSELLNKFIVNKYYIYLSTNSPTKVLYSTSVLSSASIKQRGGNNTHHQLSPAPSPIVTTNDS